MDETSEKKEEKKEAKSVTFPLSLALLILGYTMLTGSDVYELKHATESHARNGLKIRIVGYLVILLALFIVLFEHFFFPPEESLHGD